MSKPQKSWLSHSARVRLLGCQINDHRALKLSMAKGTEPYNHQAIFYSVLELDSSRTPLYLDIQFFLKSTHCMGD